MTIHQTLFSTYENLLGCDSADFDGTNDYMTRGAGLTGAADSKTGIFSVWARFDGGDGSQLNFMSTNVSNAVLAARATSGAIAVQAENAVPTIILSLGTSGTGYVASSTWYHILASWDLGAAAGHLYINDADDLGTPTLTDDTINYDGPTNAAIGATTTGSQKFNGALAEFYFAPGQYLDFSVTANRRKFISESGKPVSLGTDGSFPTGTAPIIYQHLNDGEAVANFATNLGTGGNFSITGTLETGSTSPSD